MLTAMSPAAHAGYAYGVSVDYWSYDGSTVGTNADFGNPITSTTPDAMFFYTGPVNWVYNGPQSGPNSVDTFLNINDVTSCSSPSGKFASEADFGSSTLSVDGDATSAFFWILGAGNFGTVSVTHDDGAVMYVDSYANPVIWSPGETVAVTNTAQVAPGFHEYVVTYVEGNGAPFSAAGRGSRACDVGDDAPRFRRVRLCGVSSGEGDPYVRLVRLLPDGPRGGAAVDDCLQPATA